MRKVISQKTAVKAVVLILSLIVILLIFPARVFTGILSEKGGEAVAESPAINLEHNNIMQEFTAQYKRLSSVDIYVTNVEKGRYISCLLYDENGGIALRVFADTNEFTIPGYVNIPMEINLEVGKNYSIKLQECRSKYTVGYEDISSSSPYVGNLTDNYVNVEGMHLAAGYNYRLPLSKGTSLILIAAVAAIALLLCALADIYYKKNPDKNMPLTVGQVFRVTANPIAGAVFAALMIMVFPLKIFDSRAVDIIFYELGLLITAGVVFYAINHKAVKRSIGVSFWQSLHVEDRLQYILIMFSMAMALWYACMYMNDLYDIYHTISERHMTFWLLVMMVLTFTRKKVLRFYNLLWLVCSGIGGAYYYSVNQMPDTEKEYDLHNIILKYSIYIFILAGLLVINFIRALVLAIRKKRYESGGKTSEKIAVSPFGVLLLIFFIAIIVFRNTRVWGIYLALTYTCLYIRLALWGKKKDYYKILSGGLMMNFAISLIYCFMHRYFAGYVSGRFAFLFHTVTVTAEYFTFMGAAAAVLLVVKIISLPAKTDLKGVFISAWKEMALFGFTMSYAIFTVSRTAYLAIIVSLLLVICVVIACNKKQFMRIVAVFVLSLIVSFPSAFTLQRILPTIVADPVFYPIDDTDEFVRGGGDWDSTNFMCVERFVNLFESKILGMDVGTYEYPIDRYNYADDGRGEPLYDGYGRPYDESPDNPANMETGSIDPVYSDRLLASSAFTTAEERILFEEMEDYVDTSNIVDVISNGRITIFRSYLEQMNLWGHEEMGALLPNGEIAVHAHNTYLQVAYDHGAVVGILFAVTMISALVTSISYYKKMRKTDELSLVSCAVIIGFMVAGISEWVFQYSNPMTAALMLSVAPLTFKVKVK
ncbi:MAG: hypothetical protein IJ695_09580 [Butyrivibrio sp.]|nr:hypothetical protein [Butyrivibrio sp.]